ncbi:hypothetical protein [Halorientalis litorea]|uniref:hypothetical protein n=1 Tax=Halorientalis litorea TaxID=2931977 RepID=UPI001FF2A3AF|nr:hypothetical protein [Halorientalis litorea]
MFSLTLLQTFGPLGSPPGILLTLLVLAAILVVGRVLMSLAWKLVIIGIVVVATLWVLGALGFSMGILAAAPL